MKIMQVITLCELGGAQSVVASLANSLCLDNEVIVVAGEGDGKMFSLLDERIKTERIRYLKRSISPFYDFLSLIALVVLYLKYKPDLVHLHSSKTGLLGRLAFPGKKIIYTVHGFDSIRLIHKKFLRIERILQKRCKAIVGVSNYDKNHLLAEGITNHVYTVYNGVKKPAIKESLHLDSAVTEFKKTVLCIARISRQKRFDTFLEIASLLPEYAFIWIGNQKEITGLPNNVFCLGNIPNASIYNQITDMFILPTNYEGLPMVILEAMSYGRPVVASNVGGISEMVVKGENGYAVENDPKIFAEKIKYILENKEIYNAFSEDSLQKFNSLFTINHMVSNYLNIYKTLQK